MRRCLGPVLRARHSQDGGGADGGGDEHGFVAWEDGLAEGDAATALVHGCNAAGAGVAVWFVGERFFHFAIVVAV